MSVPRRWPRRRRRASSARQRRDRRGLLTCTLEAKSLLAVQQFKDGSTVRRSDDRPSEGGGAGRKRMRASAKADGGSSSIPQLILYAESEILFPKGQQTQETFVPPDIPHPTRGRDEDEVEGGEVFVLEAFAIATSP